MARERLKLTGKRFGRLLVGEYVGIKNKASQWRCICDCGETKTITGSSMVKGYTTSCGCYHKQVFRYSNAKHSMCKTSFYKKWRGLTFRCVNPNHMKFKDYGGRGIRVCERWGNFLNFK